MREGARRRAAARAFSDVCVCVCSSKYRYLCHTHSLSLRLPCVCAHCTAESSWCTLARNGQLYFISRVCVRHSRHFFVPAARRMACSNAPAACLRRRHKRSAFFSLEAAAAAALPRRRRRPWAGWPWAGCRRRRRRWGSASPWAPPCRRRPATPWLSLQVGDVGGAALLGHSPLFFLTKVLRPPPLPPAAAGSLQHGDLHA
jgi:hypothetical protein